jgi:hypothetical protein
MNRNTLIALALVAWGGAGCLVACSSDTNGLAPLPDDGGTDGSPDSTTSSSGASSSGASSSGASSGGASSGSSGASSSGASSGASSGDASLDGTTEGDASHEGGATGTDSGFEASTDAAPPGEGGGTVSDGGGPEASGEGGSASDGGGEAATVTCTLNNCSTACCGNQCLPAGQDCSSCSGATTFCLFTTLIYELNSGYCVASCSACTTTGEDAGICTAEGDAAGE